MDQNQKLIPSKEFEFTMAENQTLLIVTLSGYFCIQHLTEIQSISKKIAAYTNTKFVAIDMTKVVDVESNMIFSFAKIQKEVRDRGLQLRVFGTPQKLKRKLFERGAIREGESSDNVAQAIKSLFKEPKPVRGDKIAA